MLLVLFVSAHAQNWTDWSGPQGAARLRARVLDPEINARQHSAGVEVEVQNVFVHHPEFANQSGMQDGILQFQADTCPVILTTDTRMTFQQLSSGTHAIVVRLLGLDNRPLAPEVKLQVRIP